MRLQTLPRAPSTMLRLWAEPSHTLSIWGKVKWSPTDLNLGLEHSSTSSEWHIDCAKLKLRSQFNLLANKYLHGRAARRDKAYGIPVKLRILPPDVRSENGPFRPDTPFPSNNPHSPIPSQSHWRLSDFRSQNYSTNGFRREPWKKNCQRTHSMPTNIPTYRRDPAKATFWVSVQPSMLILAGTGGRLIQPPSGFPRITRERIGRSSRNLG